MIKFLVTYKEAREIGYFETRAEAESAARQAGAIGEPRISGHDWYYDIENHEGNDDYSIVIEACDEEVWHIPETKG